MLTLTIAIPAYNEAANIRQLLLSVAKQQFSAEIVVQKIRVISDGSTDQTVKKARASQIKHLEVTDDQQRLGLAKRLDQICQESTSDILVILNADVIVPNTKTLQFLISPVVAGRADLTSCRIVAQRPSNWMESVLETSMRIKNRIFDTFQNGNNVYTCHGPARAFSRRLYSELRFPHSVGEDAYSYLFAIHHHFLYEYVPQAFVWYGLPSSLKDHQNQSQRYQQSKKIYIEEFGESYIKQQYHLPLPLMLREMLAEVKKSPHYVMMYVGLLAILRVRGFFNKQVSEKWDMAVSSKRGLTL